MKYLIDRITLGGDIMNMIIKRKLHPSGMIYENGGWTIKIPKKVPLFYGIIVLSFRSHTGIIEIWKRSIWGSWFSNELLDSIDCRNQENSTKNINNICNIIEQYCR
jgi:hypothetical protein